MVGLAFIALQVETAEAQISSDHPCYDIDPSNGGRDGHACWPKGEDPSVSVEASGDLGDGGAGALLGGAHSFDDGLMGAPGMSGAVITGSDSVVCGGLPGKLLETNCLRDVLDASNHAVKKAKGQKRGNYGCGNSDRFKHTACLRAILHSSDNTFAPGTN